MLLLAGSAQYEVWVAPLFEGSIPGPRGLNSILLLLVCLPLLWRRRYPALVFVVVLTAVGLQSQVEAHAGVVDRTDQGSMQGWIAALVAFYSLAAYASPRRAVVVGGLVGAGWIAVDLGRLLSGDIGLSDTVPGWFMLAAAWGLGYALRARGMQVSALVARAARDERERELRAREAVAEERARIARELHDVVAHSLSVVVVQAQAADRVLEGDQRSAREALAAIDSTGRQALVEMRRLVGMLRRGRRAESRPPARSRAARRRCSIRFARRACPSSWSSKDPRETSRPASTSRPIASSKRRSPTRSSTPARRTPGSCCASPSSRWSSRSPTTGEDPTSEAGGHGLAGMTERVALYGGELETGTSNGRGFRVLARLPL